MQTNASNPILDIPLENYLTKEKAIVRRFQSEKFIFCIQVKDERRKIFQVFFGKSDGSLYVSFPYFDKNEGILSVGILPAFLRQVNISLEQRGKVTSKRVKYTHHPDGEAHFSQKGQIFTSIRKQSHPLTEDEGHIFTLLFQSPSHFKATTPQKDHSLPTQRRTVLNFDFKNTEPEAVKIVGWWYEARSIIPRLKATTDKQIGGTRIGPTIFTSTSNGKFKRTFLIGPPQGSQMARFVLMVNCEGVQLINKTEEAMLVFIAGFDSPSNTGDLSCDTSFLCASYPASNYNELAKQIGSVDII